MSRRLALVIGNSRYNDSGLSALVAPDVDVRELGNALLSCDLGQFDEVVQLVNEPSSAVRRAIAELFHQKRREDLVLLYFSGHGIRDEAGQLYLATRDTERSLLAATAIDASFITNQMDRSASRRQVLILDCCHSGAFGAKNALGAPVGTASAFAGIGFGRVVLTATDATQYAWEGERVIGDAEPSIFTNFLVLGIQSGAADLDGDGEITIDELYEYAYDEVVNSSSKQVPGKWAFKQQGDIVIARNPRGARSADLPEALLEKIASPSPRIQLQAIRNLEVMVRGRHRARAAAARIALRQLEASAVPAVAAAARAAVAATGDSGTSGVDEQRPGHDPEAASERAGPRFPRRLTAMLAPRVARYVLLAASVVAAVALWSMNRDIAGMPDAPQPPPREASTAPTTGLRVPDAVSGPAAGPRGDPEPPSAPRIGASSESGTNATDATGKSRATAAPDRSGSRGSRAADGRGRTQSRAASSPRDAVPSVEQERGLKVSEPAAGGTMTRTEAGGTSGNPAGASATAAHRKAILDVLERYRTAYNVKDLAAIRQVFPSVARDLFGGGLRDCASFDLQFARPTVDFLSDGTATVKTLATYRCIPRTRRPAVSQPPVTDTFEFERQGDSWVIKDHLVPRGT